MAWIRLDCSTLDDEFTVSLSGDEFKAWCMFLLRVKAQGARGSVPCTSHIILSRSWNIPADSIKTMLEKAGERILEQGGRWYVKNWSKFQEDHKSKTAKGENSPDAPDGTTPPHSTLHHSTGTDIVDRQITDDAFELIWRDYPNRQGKKNALRHFKATVKTRDDLADLSKALANYLASRNVKRGFVKNGSTWFNEWQDWIEPTETMMKGQSNAGTQSGDARGTQGARATFSHGESERRNLADIEATIAKRRAERRERPESD